MVKKISVKDTEEAVSKIGASTQIIFTMKSFFALIGTLLGLFYGFYQIVIVPKVNATEKHYETLFNDQKEQNRIFYEKLGNINTAIGTLNSSVENLNKKTPEKRINNSGGSLGGGGSRADATR
jgi:hypothetical protein